MQLETIALAGKHIGLNQALRLAAHNGHSEAESIAALQHLPLITPKGPRYGASAVYMRGAFHKALADYPRQ